MNKNSPNYQEWKEKMRLHNIQLGKNRKGKTFEEIYGIEKARIIKEKMKLPKGNTQYLELIKARCNAVNKFRKGKTYEEIYGKDKAKQVINKMRGKIPWNKNIHLSEEHREKLSKAHYGKKWPKDKYPIHGMRGKTISEDSRKKMSISQSGRNHPMFGKKHKEESKRKMSETTKGMSIWNKGKSYTLEQYSKIFNEKRLRKQSKRMSLEKHPNWLGGKSFEPYTLDFNSQFKETIRNRDNYCCVICNKPQEELGELLSIHHIDYDKKNTFPQNCVSLCRNHHIDSNYNRQHWKTFFQSLLKERYGYEYTQDQKIILDFIGE